jgi:hypothetical protein
MNETQSRSTHAAWFAYNAMTFTLLLMNGSNLLCKKDTREKGGERNINSQGHLLRNVSETLLIDIKYLLEALTFRNVQLRSEVGHNLCLYSNILLRIIGTTFRHHCRFCDLF